MYCGKSQADCLTELEEDDVRKEYEVEEGKVTAGHADDKKGGGPHEAELDAVDDQSAGIYECGDVENFAMK